MVKKKQNRTPTLRQKKVMEIIVENHWKLKGEILREAWYSHATQNKPHEVFESRAIQDFFARDGSGIENLKKKHNDLLNSAEIRRLTMPITMEDEEIKTFFSTEIPGCKVLRILEEQFDKIVVLRVPDGKLQLAALDMAYKIIWVYKDPNAWSPALPPMENEEQTLRLSRAEQLFQLWTSQDSSQTTS